MRYIGLVVVRVVRPPHLQSYKAVVEATARVSMKLKKTEHSGYNCTHTTVTSGLSEAQINSLDNTAKGIALRGKLFEEMLQRLCKKLMTMGFSTKAVNQAYENANYITHSRDVIAA